MSMNIQIDDRAAKEIRKLPPELKADFVKMMKMIKEVGIDQLPDRRIKHMGRDKMFEFRMSANKMEGRAMFVRDSNDIVILSAFQKKSQKTPSQELDKAASRLSEHKRKLTCPSPLTI